MKIVAIVQARLGAERLPAKVLLHLGGKTALANCLQRACRIEGVAEVVVATSDVPTDDPVANHVRRLGLRVVRGSLRDVLARFTKAAAETEADAIVRITADCPLLDPVESARVVSAFVDSQSTGAPCDYASNVLERRYPRGLDTEVIRRDVLERIHRDAMSPDEREHVTMHVIRNRGRYRCLNVAPTDGADYSRHRWTLDTLDDFCFLAAVFDHLGDRSELASMQDILGLMAREPSLSLINQHVTQKA